LPGSPRVVVPLPLPLGCWREEVCFVEVAGGVALQGIEAKRVTAKIVKTIGLREGSEGCCAGVARRIADANSPILLLYGFDHNYYAKSISLWVIELGHFGT
jgi:hypothetical protein